MIGSRSGRPRSAPPRSLALEDRVAPDNLLGISVCAWLLPGLSVLASGESTDPATATETDAPSNPDPRGRPTHVDRALEVLVDPTSSPARPQPQFRLARARAWEVATPGQAWTVTTPDGADSGSASGKTMVGSLKIRSPSPEALRLPRPSPESGGKLAATGRAAPLRGERSALPSQTTVAPIFPPMVVDWGQPARSAEPLTASSRVASADPSGAITAATAGVVDIDGKDAEAGAAILDEFAEDDPGVLIQDADAADKATLLARQTGVTGAKRIVTWDATASIEIRDKATNEIKTNGFKLLEAEGNKEYSVVATANMALGAAVTVTLRAEGAGMNLGLDDLKLTRFQFALVNPGDTNSDGNLNDDANAGNRFTGNEFTFSTANPGVLTLPVSVRVRPDSPATREKFKDKIHLTVDAIGDSHIEVGPRQTSLAWDRGASLDDFRIGLPAYDPATKLWTATATFTGLPARGSDFGVKTVTARLTNNVMPAQTAKFEVFWPLLINSGGARNDPNFAKNHPGPDLNATRADSANQFPRDATRAPNWYYYWRQEIPGTGQDRYADALVADLFGVSPPVYYYSNNYVGRHDRVLIFAPAQGVDSDPDGMGPRQKTTGIDAFRDTFIHENFHSLSESVTFTNEGFGAAITGASLVVATDWSFNIAKPAVLPVPPLNFAGGRIYNHYRDTNNDGDFADATDLNKDGDTDDLVGGVPENEDMDRDGDSVPNWADPTPGVPGPGKDLANRALNAEPDKEDFLADKDWGNPGKNHATKAYDT